MENNFQKLWKKKKLPMINGLCKSDGTFYKLEDGKLIKTAIPIKKYDISHVYINAQIEHQGTTYFCGEGSWGDDGFLVALKDNTISWLFSGDLNPLEKLWIEDENIHVLNNCKVEWVIPLAEPEKALASAGAESL